MSTFALSELLKLPVPERLRLVEAIWDSIADVPEAIALSDAERAELDRRLEAFLKNPREGSPWPEVKARITRQR
jgi:putative addiction module component (TIGR02574 family)